MFGLDSVSGFRLLIGSAVSLLSQLLGSGHRWPPMERRTSSGGVRAARAVIGRLLGRALFRSAALHYLNASNGVKGLDVCSFCAEYSG